MKQLKKTLSILLVIMTILTICSTAMPVIAAGDLFSNKTLVAESYVQQEMTSKIVGEVSELREEYAKHFVCEDGSYVVATYTEPIHYKENGKWKEIDNSLKLTSEVKSGSGKSMYAPKAGPADVSIPQSFSNDQKISATNKGHTISFGVSQGMNVRLNKSATVISDVEDLSSNKQVNKAAMLQKAMTLSTTSTSEKNEITEHNNEAMAVENQSGAIVYEDIFNNADLEYIVTTNSIKENIVVQKKQYDYTYSFDMDFGELVPIVNEDNSIRVIEPETEETVFFVAAPYMYDENGIESTEIDMSLVEEDGIFVLTLKASTDWINASERAFPVVIDPTVYMSYNDVYVMSGVVNQNNTKLNNEIRIGKNVTNSTRTYIKPQIPSNIPAGSYINNAQLILQKDYYFQFVGASDIHAYAFDCYKIASWDPSTITWKNQPVDNSKNGYANCDLEFLSSVEATSGRTEYPFDITNAVRRWFAGGRNNGIMLASSNESTTTQVDFYSSRAKDSSTYPQIYITYTAPNVSIYNWNTDSQAKESSAFTITTSSNWTASSNASWISLSTTSGNGIGSSKIIVTENTSVFDRVGTVTVKMGGTVIGTITVTQYGKKPNIELDITSLNFNAGSSKQTVNITSNTTWSFSNLPEWITVTPSEGSMNSTVEIGVSVNNDADIRASNITVTADTITKTINVVQLNDAEAPAKPNIYEQDGLVYISSRSFDFNKDMDSPEHIEYKIENGEWTNYDGKPLNIVRTYGAKVYARVRDDATNISPIAEIILENTLGEYTASYTDIALGEGLFPVEFGRTYTSTNGWFFTFDANIVKIDDNAYVFTDFYGEKQYFIKNGEGKYLSVDEEELTVNADSYVLTYGEMICTFSSDGKINRIVTDYLDTQYTWNEDGTLTITGGATVTFVYGRPIKINITREGQVKEVEYVWVEGNLTKFIDAADVEHNYAYTNGLLTTNETETITYSDQGRVKLISQPNSSFVKYTYNDTTIQEGYINPGIVTISNSQGISDIWYYESGIYISNALECYSDRMSYSFDSISSEITEDIIDEVVYTVLQAENDRIETEDKSDKSQIDENIVIYEELDENTYVLYSYDEYGRVSAEIEVLKSNIADITIATFESAVAVAERKVTYAYVSDKEDSVIEKNTYVKSQSDLVLDEKECYTYENGDVKTRSKYKYVDTNEISLYNESYEYNTYGNVISHIETQYATDVDAFDVTYTTSYAYDIWGMCTGITVTCENNVDTTITEYDLNGVTLSVTYNDEKVIYTYTDFGTVDKETVVKIDGETETVKQETDYDYDDFGNLKTCTNPDGDTSYYYYDDYGNLTNHNFNGYFFTYNTLGSILTASVNDDVLVAYTYEGAEQELSSVQYANGQTLNYVYDDETGELTTVKQGEETKFSYSYSTVGEDEITTLTDNINNIIKVIENDKVIVKANADTVLYSVENLYEDEETEGSFNGKKITVGSDIYTLKSEGNKDSFYVGETETEVFVKTYEDDYAENLWKVNTANSVSTEYGYNEDKNISTLKNTLNGLVQTFGYGYDDEGNITTETLNIVTSDENGATVETNKSVNYTYDEDNQLLSAETADTKWAYTYDGRGNITSKTEYSVIIGENNDKVYTEVYSKEYKYDDAVWADKLTEYDEVGIEYDAVGNPIEYLDHNLEWSFGRQLTKFDTNTYTYNEDGVRISKTVDGIKTIYYLDGTNIIEQSDGINTLHFYYDSNDVITGFTYGENNYFYVKNVVGDIVGIVDSNGSLVVSYTYDAWGKVLSVTGSDIELGNLNPFRYRSYYYDSDIEMYYLQSRYYDPEVCRFINSDDVNFIGATGTVGSYNAFAYCENNPINNIDYTGYWLETIIDIISLISSIFDVIQDPNSGWAWLGLGGDVVDLLPIVSGVGEGARALKVADKVSDAKKAKKAASSVSDTKRIFNVSKQNSTIFNSFSTVKGKSYRTSGKGKKQKFYQWDYTHNDIEVYDSNGKHLGSMDPITGEMYKDAVAGRKLEK